jgi:uncharacterized protein YcbX
MEEGVGTVRAQWRFPVKSMLGEELDSVDLGEAGVTGDRAYAIVDRETGKVASARRGVLQMSADCPRPCPRARSSTSTR